MKRDTASLDAILADPRVVWVEDVLRYADMDVNGHVNNSVFSVLCESGRVNMFRTRFGARAQASTYFVIARLTIEFDAELLYPGRVRTGTWVTRIGRTSFGIGQVIVSEEGGLAGTSDCVSVLMDGATRQPRPIDGDLRLAAETALRA